jgi:arylsulfatase A-like enzyme
MFDDALNHLDTRLTALGFDASNTVFMVIADHGEGMSYPGHHGYAHGQYHTSSTNHVPWLVGGPGVASNHRVLGVTSQVDLVPTLLGLVGAPLPVDQSTQGTDLSYLVRGEGHESPHEQVWSDTWFGESSRAAVFTHEMQCQDDFGSSEKQREKGKFTPGCYDRHADALFEHPLENASLLASLHAWRAAREADLRGSQVDAVTIDGELNRQLEMLGYHE